MCAFQDSRSDRIRGSSVHKIRQYILIYPIKPPNRHTKRKRSQASIIDQTFARNSKLALTTARTLSRIPSISLYRSWKTSPPLIVTLGIGTARTGISRDRHARKRRLSATCEANQKRLYYYGGWSDSNSNSGRERRIHRVTFRSLSKLPAGQHARSGRPQCRNPQ